jgi:hypothetical protein
MSRPHVADASELAIIHSRERFSQQRGCDPESVGHHRVNHRPQGRQGAERAAPRPSASRAAGRSCSTHQWMRGWIVVTDDVSAVTGTDGTFTLPDLPPGRYEIVVWLEQLRAATQTVTVASGQSVPLAFAMQ